MKRLFILLFISILCLFTTYVSAETDFRRISLRGVNFVDYSLQQFLQDKNVKATVIVLAGTDCPLVRQYIPTLAQLRSEYESKGIQFIALYAGRQANVSSMALHALEFDMPFRALLDVNGEAASALELDRLTKVVVLDRQNKVLYQGAIDDQFTVGGRKDSPSEDGHYLRTALAEIVTGKEVGESFTIASGCNLEKSAPNIVEVVPTYYKDVAPIVQKNCQPCHRSKEVGSSFAEFMTYEDIANHATTIREVVVDGRMPPSYQVMNPELGKLRNDRRLSEDDKSTIDRWVRGGMPKGDAKDAPAPVVYDNREWKIGKPDLVLKMKKSFRVPATGIIDYQFFKMSLNYEQDHWVQAVELKPGIRSVVHHMEVHIVPHTNENYEGPDAMQKVYGTTGDRAYLLSGFIPGDDDDNARVYPAGQAMRIPAHHDLVMEVHYTSIGSEQIDASSVGIIWAKAAPVVELCAHTFRFSRDDLYIPAHNGHAVSQGEVKSLVNGKIVKKNVVGKELWFKKDVTLWSFRAHMHKIGKSWKLEQLTTLEDGSTAKVFFAGIPTWDYGWQRSFDLAEPIKIKAGQRFLMTGVWDNSRYNAYNSDPQRPKSWGIQTNDEMLNTRVKYSIDHNEHGAHRCRDAVP